MLSPLYKLDQHVFARSDLLSSHPRVIKLGFERTYRFAIKIFVNCGFASLTGMKPVVLGKLVESIRVGVGPLIKRFVEVEDHLVDLICICVGV